MTATDYPLSLNPAYRSDDRPFISSSDSIDVPIYDQEGTEIETETVHFSYEIFGRDVKIRVKPYRAHSDDAHALLRQRFENYKIEIL